MKFIHSRKWGRSGNTTGGETVGQWYDVNSRKAVNSSFERPEYSMAGDKSGNYSLKSYGDDSGKTDSASLNCENVRKRRHTQKSSVVNPGAFRVVCLLLACLVIGAIGGVVAFYLLSISLPTNAHDSDTAQEIQSVPPQVEDTKSSISDDNTVKANNGDAAASGHSTNELSGQEIYALGCSQTVGVTTEVTGTNVFGQPTSSTLSGTGIVISDDGYILTNYHVVEAAVTGDYEINVVLNDGSSYKAEFIGKESDNNDVALLKIEATDLNVISIGNSNNMEVGEQIYTVGNPLGELTYTFTTGIVSALNGDITSSKEDGTSDTINMFQIDAAVNSGNSGGPVYNVKGEVIGIVTSKYNSSSTEGIGFAMPINDVMDIVDDLMNYGYVSGKATMSIETYTLGQNEAKYYELVEGAFILYITPGSCAEVAGLHTEDIIVQIGDYDITSTSDYNAALKNYSAGDSTLVKAYRSGSYFDFDVTFDEDSGEPVSSNYRGNKSS